MSHETEGQLVRQITEAHRRIEDLRWHELATLDAADARLATDALIEAALAVPLSPKRHSSSGLVEQQAFFHRINRS